MTKETRIELLLDQYNEKRDALKKEYDDNYATEGLDAKGTLELNCWFVEEENKLNKWLVESIQALS